MILTKKSPYTKQEIEQLKERFGVYIKTVIDVKQGVCSAGCDRHFESEEILLKQGSAQCDLWGGGIDLKAGVIDYNSIINIRPKQNNNSNEIQDSVIRKHFEDLTKEFFKEAL